VAILALHLGAISANRKLKNRKGRNWRAGLSQKAQKAMLKGLP
jgi:hypothetical protein